MSHYKSAYIYDKLKMDHRFTILPLPNAEGVR